MRVATSSELDHAAGSLQQQASQGAWVPTALVAATIEVIDRALIELGSACNNVPNAAGNQASLPVAHMAMLTDPAQIERDQKILEGPLNEENANEFVDAAARHADRKVDGIPTTISLSPSSPITPTEPESSPAEQREPSGEEPVPEPVPAPKRRGRPPVKGKGEGKRRATSIAVAKLKAKSKAKAVKGSRAKAPKVRPAPNTKMAKKKAQVEQKESMDKGSKDSGAKEKATMSQKELTKKLHAATWCNLKTSHTTLIRACEHAGHVNLISLVSPLKSPQLCYSGLFHCVEKGQDNRR